MNDKFDPFEEFNNEIESQGNQIFDMRLIHNKSRENLFIKVFNNYNSMLGLYPALIVI